MPFAEVSTKLIDLDGGYVNGPLDLKEAINSASTVDEIKAVMPMKD